MLCIVKLLYPLIHIHKNQLKILQEKEKKRQEAIIAKEQVQNYLTEVK